MQFDCIFNVLYKKGLVQYVQEKYLSGRQIDGWTDRYLDIQMDGQIDIQMDKQQTLSYFTVFNIFSNIYYIIKAWSYMFTKCKGQVLGRFINRQINKYVDRKIYTRQIIDRKPFYSFY